MTTFTTFYIKLIDALDAAIERKRITGKKVLIYESNTSTHENRVYTLDRKFGKNKRSIGSTN